MRRNLWMGVVAGLVLAAITLGFWCGVASAVDFKQHKPNYIITNYGSDIPDSSNAPRLELQVSIALPLLEAISENHKLTIPYFPDGNPMLAFSLHAWWAIADESSPFTELDWNPQAYYQMFDKSAIPVWHDIRFDGLDVGWEHVSTGVAGIDSRGWDRVVTEGTFNWKALTLYARPWWTFNYDAFTEQIANVVNLKGSDFGAEAILKLATDDLTLAATVGNGYQDYEIAIPLQDAWNIALYGQLHHGYYNSLVNYAESVTSGGAGIVLKR